MLCTVTIGSSLISPPFATLCASAVKQVPHYDEFPTSLWCRRDLTGEAEYQRSRSENRKYFRYDLDK